MDVFSLVLENNPNRWSPKLSIVVRQVHIGESGTKEIPNLMCNPITNYGPGIAEPKLTQVTAFSQPLLVPDGCERAVKRALS